MDALSEILKSMKMGHVRAGTLSFTAPWAVAVEGLDMPTAYGVSAGGPCWLRVPDREAIQLARGDVVLVKGPHQLLSSPESHPVLDMRDIFSACGVAYFKPNQEPISPLHIKWGAGGAETRMLGLAFEPVGGERNPLVASLPRCIVLRSGRFTWIDSAIEFLTLDGVESPGYAATARLLAELIFVSIVRAHLLNESKGSRGWLCGLTDPGIAKALLGMHESPGTDWTVGSLASMAALSRTAFAARFADLVGVTPIHYLTQWRMHLAAERILRSRTNLTQLAFELGYASDAAFRDAFKRRYGIAPSRFGLDKDPRDGEQATRD